jgi:hypothetical protein
MKGLPVPIVQEAGWAPEPVWTQRLEETSSASVGDLRCSARFYLRWDGGVMSALIDAYSRFIKKKGVPLHAMEAHGGEEV